MRDRPPEERKHAMQLSLSIYSLDQAFAADGMTVSDSVRFACGVGVEAIELGYYWQDEAREIDAVCGALAETGLAVSGYLVSNNFALDDPAARRTQVEKVKHGIDAAKRLGTDVVRIFAGKRPGGSFVADRDRVVEALAECLAYAAPRGVRLAMEDHGGVGGTSEHLLYYAEKLASDHFGFVVDIANFLANAGEEPLSAVRRVAPHALLVQAKDGILDGNGDWVPRLCGEGQVPLEEALIVLREAGYDGYVSIEYEVPIDCRIGIAHEVAYLRPLLARIDGILNTSDTFRGRPSKTKV